MTPVVTASAECGREGTRVRAVILRGECDSLNTLRHRKRVRDVGLLDLTSSGVGRQRVGDERLAGKI